MSEEWAYPTPQSKRALTTRQKWAVGGAIALLVATMGGCMAAVGSADVEAKDADPEPSSRVYSPPSTEVPTTDAPTTTSTTAPAVTVTVIVDGDTVELSTGERVRLVGIDTPESGTGDCASKATARLTELVLDHPVALMAGARDNADHYGRLLRYVDTDVDAGLQLIVEGLAITRYDSRDGYGRHTREPDYVAADSASPNSANTPPPTTRTRSCPGTRARAGSRRPQASLLRLPRLHRHRHRRTESRAVGM